MRGPVVRTGEMEGLWVASSHLQAWEVGSRNAYAELNSGTNLLSLHLVSSISPGDA